MTGRPGRPLSAELSEQLLTAAVDILAEEGWRKLTSDRIATRAHTGKAGIYRRWPTMAAMVRSAMGRFTLLQVPPDSGSLREDLAALIDRWRWPLDREEQVVASLLGAARHHEDLRAGLDTALVRPLAEAVKTIGARAIARGEQVPAARLTRLASVIEAFYWQRYASHRGAMTPEEVQGILDQVLLPLVAPDRERALV